MVFFITSSLLCIVSLLTLTAISVDRLLALLLALRYRQVVTLRRAYGTVIAFWAVRTFSSTIRFFLNFNIKKWYRVSSISLCLATSTYSYTRIIINLHHRQNQLRRYRKAVSTALWLQFTLVACYVPYAVSVTWLIHAKLSSSVFLALSYTATLIFLNSTLNPILYCWKIDEVREAVKDTIRKVLCC